MFSRSCATGYQRHPAPGKAAPGDVVQAADSRLRSLQPRARRGADKIRQIGIAHVIVRPRAKLTIECALYKLSPKHCNSKTAWKRLNSRGVIRAARDDKSAVTQIGCERITWTYWAKEAGSGSNGPWPGCDVGEHGVSTAVVMRRADRRGWLARHGPRVPARGRAWLEWRREPQPSACREILRDQISRCQTTGN